MLSARFLQFYEQYLSETEQPYYRYSPVFMELYDSGYRLLEQGCPKSAVGNKSARISSSICRFISGCNDFPQKRSILPSNIGGLAQLNAHK